MTRNDTIGQIRYSSRQIKSYNRIESRVILLSRLDWIEILIMESLVVFVRNFPRSGENVEPHLADSHCRSSTTLSARNSQTHLVPSYFEMESISKARVSRENNLVTCGPGSVFVTSQLQRSSQDVQRWRRAFRAASPALLKSDAPRTMLESEQDRESRIRMLRRNLYEPIC